MLRLCMLAILVAAVSAQTVINWDASAYCFQCLSRRNHKDLYPDPLNCHNYYQCQYIDETHAIATLRSCPPGQFWHDAVMTCLLEGSSQCVDRCLDDATHAGKCYAGANCRQYFVCSKTGSIGMCCPAGTQFDASTCGCDHSSTCNAVCTEQGSGIATTVSPPTRYNDTVCRDSFGSYITAVAGNVKAYGLIDEEGHSVHVLHCPIGYSFSLETCACDIANGDLIPSTQTNRKAIFYMSFNPPNAKTDKSINHFTVFFYDGADITPGFSAHSATGGSLLIPNQLAHVSVPGLKSYDFGPAVTWCTSFRCDHYAGNLQCNESGAILSNNKDELSSEFTFVFGVQPTNKFVAKLGFVHLANTVTLNGAFDPLNAKFNTFCTTYDGETANLYLQGLLVDSKTYKADLKIAHCPTVLGNDQALGTFRGHIDGAVILPYVWDAAGILNFHLTGDIPTDAL